MSWTVKRPCCRGRAAKVDQETLGWDETNEVTVSQRSKEEAHDYRYFPEPDLPPLVINPAEIEAARERLPERPDRKFIRFMADLRLDAYQAEVLTVDRDTAEFYESVVNAMPRPDAGLAANWVSGELFGIMNATNMLVETLPISPAALAGLLDLLQQGKVNNATAKTVLEKMVATEQQALTIIEDGRPGPNFRSGGHRRSGASSFGGTSRRSPGLS